MVKCNNNFTPSIFVSDLTLLTTDNEYTVDWYWNGIYYGQGSDFYVNSDEIFLNRGNSYWLLNDWQKTDFRNYFEECKHTLFSVDQPNTIGIGCTQYAYDS